MTLNDHHGNMDRFLNKIWILCIAWEIDIWRWIGIPQLEASFHFSQPISPCLKVSQVCVAWYLLATHSYLTSPSNWKQGNWGWFGGYVFWWWKDRGGARVRGERVNPICHVLTVLIRGLCWEEPLYPFIPCVYFEPRHLPLRRRHCSKSAPSILTSSLSAASNASHEVRALLCTPSSTIKNMTALTGPRRALVEFASPLGKV